MIKEAPIELALNFSSHVFKYIDYIAIIFTYAWGGYNQKKKTMGFARPTSCRTILELCA